MRLTACVMTKEDTYIRLMKSVHMCVGMRVKMTRCNLFLCNKDGGNGFLKYDHDDDEDGLININITTLSLACNQVMV